MLPMNFPFSSLNSLKVTQLRVGENELIIIFDSEDFVRIEGEVEISSNSEKIRGVITTMYGVIHNILGLRIRYSTTSNYRDLCIVFENHVTWTLFGVNENYECYTISLEGIEYVV